MPTIMTTEEAKYQIKFQEYQSARVAFYAGKITPTHFIAKRNEMEAAMALAYK